MNVMPLLEFENNSVIGDVVERNPNGFDIDEELNHMKSSREKFQRMNLNEIIKT